jgi:hypothetical protein
MTTALTAGITKRTGMLRRPVLNESVLKWRAQHMPSGEPCR